MHAIFSSSLLAANQHYVCGCRYVFFFFNFIPFLNCRSLSRRMLMHLFLQDRLAEPCDSQRQQHQRQTFTTTPAGGPPPSRGVRLISSHFFFCSLCALLRFPGKMSMLISIQISMQLFWELFLFKLENLILVSWRGFFVFVFNSWSIYFTPPLLLLLFFSSSDVVPQK